MKIRIAFVLSGFCSTMRGSAANRHRAEICVLPALDMADVSPADFSRTAQLIDWAIRRRGDRYRSDVFGWPLPPKALS